jgi:amidase
LTTVRFSVVEATMLAMQQAMREGRTTSRDLVLQYLARIAFYDRILNATLAVNRGALEEADALGAERARGMIRGPLHGIPIAVKDNVHTTHMPTTGGALAFAGFTPPYEAPLVTKLRAAGAIILAKTVMTELANWVAAAMPGNYSAVGGYGMNPYDPRRDPRDGTNDGRPVLSVGGSSSGIGTAANLWAASVGSETSGSILVPSNQNMLAGIKPTVGRISGRGVIPITADQDTAGPMARTVADAALLLAAMEEAAGADYTPHLKAGALRGARIGIPRAFYYDRITPPGATEPQGGLNDAQAKVMAEAIDVLRAQGATVVDPADIPSVIDPDPAENFVTWNICGDPAHRKGEDARCSVVLKYGMKRDFNAWLATLGPAAPVKSLAELRAFNAANQGRNAIKYAQARLDIADEMDLDLDRARYEADRRTDLRLAAEQGIDATLRTHGLDALVFPGAAGAAIAARPGYPTVIVPFGMVPNAPTPPFPDGFDARPGPFGVSFTGPAWSEPRLIELAYAFEQATRRRVPPPLFP